MNSIKNVIFDIGNVLVDFHPIPYFQKLMPQSDMDTICPLIFDETWEKIDQGIYTCEEAKNEHMQKLPQFHPEIECIYAQWKEMMDLNKETYAYLKACQSHGYQVYLLSNIGLESHQYLKARYAFFDDADGAILSYQEHVLKPDQKIYELLLSRYGLNAEECVFFDDNAANVTAACTLGIKGIRFINCEQAKQEAALW